MMKVFRTFIQSPLFWLLLFTILYFLVRLTNLTMLPIFTDEAIYIRWSQIGANDASWRFISLTDGKQPLFTWFVMAALRVFHDPLYAGRIVSVFSGFAGMIGLFFLGREIFHKDRIGVLASFLYLISPFTLMYDRMALYDSLVAAISVWNLYIAILLVRRVRLDVALIFGLTLGLGMLNKTSAFLSLYLLPVTIVLFDWSKKERSRRFLKWVCLCVISAVLSQVVYSILRLSPYFYIVSQKDTLFVYPFGEWVTHPFRFLIGNLHGEFDWLIHYLTVPVFLASLAPLLYPFKKPMEKFVLAIWWFAPFFALALFGKVLYPRFVLFMAMPLLILCASTVDWIMSTVRMRAVKTVFACILFLPCLFTSYKILYAINEAQIPKSDIGQYVNDWPSGWGTKEVVAYFSEESKKGQLSVYTEGTFGLFPYALEIYLVNNKNITIHGLWPPSKTLPSEVKLSAEKMPTYYVSNETQTQPDWPLQLINKYQKGNNNKQHMTLYKVVLPEK